MTLPILPDIQDPETKPFWEATRQRQLVVQKCADCGHLRFPPHPGCPTCHSVSATWQAVSGKGDLWSFVVAHGPTLPAFQNMVPFPVGVVTLSEGSHLRIVGNLIATPGAAINSLSPSVLKVGMPLAIAFLEVDDVILPAWVPQ